MKIEMIVWYIVAGRNDIRVIRIDPAHNSGVGQLIEEH